MSLGVGSKITHPSLGRGVIVDIGSEFYTIWFKGSNTTKSISKDFQLDIVSAAEHSDVTSVVDLADLEMMLNRVLDARADIQEMVELGNKWENGVVILKPGEENLQSKEFPIETFFHKIVMVRDRLRVLEQNINSHKLLSDEDKVNMQQYITRAYGSLTTFNVLFKNPLDAFKGAGGKD